MKAAKEGVANQNTSRMQLETYKKDPDAWEEKMGVLEPPNHKDKKRKRNEDEKDNNAKKQRKEAKDEKDKEKKPEKVKKKINRKTAKRKRTTDPLGYMLAVANHNNAPLDPSAPTESFKWVPTALLDPDSHAKLKKAKEVTKRRKQKKDYEHRLHMQVRIERSRHLKGRREGIEGYLNSFRTKSNMVKKERRKQERLQKASATD
jgi:hypothetical protein